MFFSTEFESTNMAEDANTQQNSFQGEEELQLKKRARRRLVGAIALVLAMLVILPMILDDKATKPQAPITISIPDEDNAEFASKIVPLPPVDAAPVVPAKSAETLVNNVTADALPVEKTETAPNNEIELAPVETEKAKPVVPEPIISKPVISKPAQSEAKTADTNPELTTTIKPAMNKVASNKTGHFAVQIGVFSNADSVKDLQVKLLENGVKTHTNTIKTDKGDKIRLRTNSFDSREAATEALNSIKTAGLTGMIVAE